MRNKNYKIDDLNSKISNSIKWTSITEVFSKLAVPIMNMILARLISSQIFGIVASVQVVVSFAEIISEGGYAKFILQKKFSSGNERRSSVGTGLLTSIFFGRFAFFNNIYF